MRISVHPSAVRQTSTRDNLIRFTLGGAITVAAALVAKRYGPAIGGLFLAFPAIFPAGATLIQKKEKQKMERAGSKGQRRALFAVALDARGTEFGCIALMAFAVVLWPLLRHQSLIGGLALATVTWVVTAVSIWWIHRPVRRWISRR